MRELNIQEVKEVNGGFLIGGGIIWGGWFGGWWGCRPIHPPIPCPPIRPLSTEINP